MTYEGKCRLGDLFTNRREKGRAGLPTLSVTLNDGLVNREDLDRKQETSLSPEEHLLVKPGDIAYNMMRMWQGAFGLAREEGLISPAYVVLKAKQAIDPQFAFFLLKSERMRYLLWAYSYGLTDDRLRLYFQDFCKIPVQIPALEVQKSISSALISWDKAAQIVDLQIASCRLEMTLFQQRFMRSLASGKIVAESVPLSRVATFHSGGTPAKSVPGYWNGTIPWVTAKDMKSLYVGDSELKITEEARRKRRSVPSGCVLILTRGMTLLHTVPICVSTVELTFNQDVKALVPTAHVSGEFLAHSLRAHENQILQLVNTAGHGTGRLDTNLLKDFSLAIPPSDFQEKFVAAMRSMEQRLVLLSRYRELLNLEKRALMQQLLTGERRVRVPATEAESSAS